MTRLSGALALLVLVAMPTVASATVLPATQRVARIGVAGHPREATLVLPVTESMPGAIRACIEYGSTIRRATGRIKVRVELFRDGERVDAATFGGRVRKTSYFSLSDGDTAFYGCSEPGEIKRALEAGDVLVFALKYRKFPDPRDEVVVVTAGVVR